ncbi:hypothetical protein RZS08_55760, partial [Arthrospira platensis SPKY1]|nr:hypothetical protein [Arthrospira platensis SPKY1]
SGSGTVTIVGSGVTIRGLSGLNYVLQQFDTIDIRKVSNTEYALVNVGRSETNTALAQRAPSGAFINSTFVTGVKTAVETPAAIFAAGSALANRTTITLRNESTNIR